MPRIRRFEIANHVLAKRTSRAHARLQKHSHINLNYHKTRDRIFTFFEFALTVTAGIGLPEGFFLLKFGANPFFSSNVLFSSSYGAPVKTLILKKR